MYELNYWNYGSLVVNGLMDMLKYCVPVKKFFMLYWLSDIVSWGNFGCFLQ